MKTDPLGNPRDHGVPDGHDCDRERCSPISELISRSGPGQLAWWRHKGEPWPAAGWITIERADPVVYLTAETVDWFKRGPQFCFSTLDHRDGVPVLLRIEAEDRNVVYALTPDPARKGYTATWPD